jgi:transitional endoplasmic reticulum ATPase
MKLDSNTDSKFGISLYHQQYFYYYKLLLMKHINRDVVESSITFIPDKHYFVERLKNEVSNLVEVTEGNRLRRFSSIEEEFESILQNEFRFNSFLNSFDQKFHVERLFVKLLLCEFQNSFEISNTEIDESFTVVSELRRLFQLSDAELKFLKFAVVFENDDNDFQRVLENVAPNQNDKIKTVSYLTGLSRSQIKAVISSGSNLSKSGIVDVDLSFKGRYGGIDVDETIMEFVSGLRDSSSLLGKYINEYTGAVLPPESFTVSTDDRSIIMEILRHDTPCNLLFYGKAGTGKTEFVKSLINSCGKRALFVKTPDKSVQSEERSTALVAAVNIYTKDDIIVVDEADSLINSSNSFFPSEVDKGWLNEFLDSSRAKIIWISNRTNGVEESHMRRFNYSLFFDSFTCSDREKIWKQILKGRELSHILTDEDIEYYSSEFEVNAAGIASACDTAEQLIKNTDYSIEKIKNSIDKVLREHEKVITGNVYKQKKLFSLRSNYDPAFINANTDINSIVEKVSSFSEEMKQNVNIEHGSNLLLYGIPGTGKTEFTKFLAKRLKRKINYQRASDLLSPFVGVTEQLLERAFNQSARDGSILFIDEADTFFLDRASSQRSWEVSRTNELLSLMENYRGILVCCTNLQGSIDKAALRRFHFKIEFKPLNVKQKVDAFHAFFPNLTLTKSLEKTVKSLAPLTPGDFKAVSEAHRYSENLNVKKIVEDLQIEVELKNSGNDVIGF